MEGLKEPIKDMFLSDRSLEIDLDFDPLSYSSNFPKNHSDISKLQKRLRKLDLNKIWKRKKKNYDINNNVDQVIFLKVHRGFFLDIGIHDWEGFNDALIFIVENPGLVKESMYIQCEFISKYLEIVLKNIDVDAVIFNEPIGGNAGPLISPEMYEELALKFYRNIIEQISAFGINNLIIRSYANIKLMIPSILKYGFNTLWACESENDAMDYIKLRNEYGINLKLIGGIDLDKFRYGKESIKNEVVAKVPLLLRSGGYIPLADGRIRKDISFSNYIYYRKLLEEITRN